LAWDEDQNQGDNFGQAKKPRRCLLGAFRIEIPSSRTSAPTYTTPNAFTAIRLHKWTRKLGRFSANEVLDSENILTDASYNVYRQTKINQRLSSHATLRSSLIGLTHPQRQKKLLSLSPKAPISQPANDPSP
jgi:hypothetical protein